MIETGNHIQQGRFAGAVGPYDNRNFTLIHANGAVMQNICSAVTPRHIMAIKEIHELGSKFSAGLLFKPVPR